jgi:uracil DNA glycosylase
LVISQTKSISFVYYDMVCSNWFPQLENFRDHMLLIFAKFIETEICSRDDYIYPPQHLIFNALNTTPFHSVKAVILGQVCGFSI